MARRGQPPRGPWPVVQVRYKTGLTSVEYVTTRAWRHARLERCPLHPEGGCGLRRHGTYGRVEPPGARVARYFCRRQRATISLLPDCLAAKLSSTLHEVEQVVRAVEAGRSLWAAAERLRPDLTLLCAARWVRRRLVGVRASLAALVGLFPEVLSGVAPTLADFSRVLAGRPVLVTLREFGAAHLSALPPPLGFGQRVRPLPSRRRRWQHGLGPDPPPKSR